MPSRNINADAQPWVTASYREELAMICDSLGQMAAPPKQAVGKTWPASQTRRRPAQNANNRLAAGYSGGPPTLIRTTCEPHSRARHISPTVHQSGEPLQN
jgi:hypothetical protein